LKKKNGYYKLTFFKVEVLNCKSIENSGVISEVFSIFCSRTGQNNLRIILTTSMGVLTDLYMKRNLI